MKRRRQLTPEAIIETAIRVADAEGLEAVSIRRVAAELNSRPMSFYGHFPSKEDLLAKMGEEVVKEILLDEPLPEDWRAALSAIAKRMYAAFVSHPWLVSVFSRRPRFRPTDTQQAKQMAQAVASLGLEPAEIWLVLGTVNDYVLGHSQRAVTKPSSEELQDVIPKEDLADSPELASLPDSLRSRSSVERFEAGLEIVFDGIERRVLDVGE